MMQAWVEWARGPLFYFSFTFMVLGLLRHIVLTLWEAIRVYRRAGDKNVPYKQALMTTLKWLMPAGQLRNRFVFSVTSILFHIAIIVVPVFLAGHIILWTRGLGISWPAIPNELADALTILAVLTAVALVLQRLMARATRALSRPGDYALPLLVALPFATGFMLMHPQLNPFSFEAMFFFHIMSGNLIFVLMPLTKLSHAVLMPSVQVVSELGWKWPQDSGSRVGVALHKEEEPV